MQQNPSWKAKKSLTSQDIPRILRNPKFHYSNHLSLSRATSIQFMSPNPLLKIYFNSILTCTATHLQSGLFLSDLPTKNPVCTSPLPNTCHMPRPSHSSCSHYNTPASILRPSCVRKKKSGYKYKIFPQEISEQTTANQRALNRTWEGAN